MLKFPKSSVFHFYILTIAAMASAMAQGPESFTISDFDLKGPVKSCFVITGYGQEEFYFDTNGRLTKTKTVHSSGNYDITYYKYAGDALIERRDEVYRDNIFNRALSMAHIYSLDTLGTRKLTESIISYARVNMEQFDYYYDASGAITRIVRTDNSGVDETLIERDTSHNLITETHILNEKKVKAILRTLDRTASGKEVTMSMFMGEAQGKVEIEVDSTGRVIKEIEWSMPRVTRSEDPFETEFEQRVEKEHVYDANGLLLKTITTRGRAVSEQEYVHQLDGTEYENWIKQIVTPQNTYVTRKISYYHAAGGQ